MSDGNAEKTEDLSRKTPDRNPELAEEAASSIGDPSIGKFSTQTNAAGDEVLKDLEVKGAEDNSDPSETDKTDKSNSSKDSASREEHELLKDCSIEGGSSEQNWRDQELVRIKKQQQINELERKAHSSGAAVDMSAAPSETPPKTTNSNSSEQAWRDQELARIKHEQEIAALEKQMHSSTTPVSPAKPSGNSNDSEIEWRQKELERIKKEQEIAALEKQMHSSTPPVPPVKPAGNSNNSEIEWRQKELDRLKKEQEIAALEKQMHSSTAPVPPAKPAGNSNNSEIEWRQKELDRLQREKLIAEQEKQMHSSTPPRELPKPVNTGVNSNNSEIEWRQKELQQLKKQQEIAALEKQMHSSTTPLNRPNQEAGKPRVEAASAKPAEPAKPRTESTLAGNSTRPESKDKPKSENTVGGYRPENRERAAPSRELAQPVSKKDNVPNAPELKKPEAPRPVGHEPKAVQMLARQNSAEAAEGAQKLTKPQELVQKAKVESTIAQVNDRHTTEQAQNKTDSDKKPVLNLSLLSQVAADLRSKDTALARKSSTIPYTVLARQANSLDATKADGVKSLSSQARDGGNPDAQKTIRGAMLPVGLKSYENSAVSARSLDATRLSAGERQRSAYAATEGARPLSATTSIKTALTSSAADSPRPINLSIRGAQANIAQIDTPGRVAFVPARTGGADSNVSNSITRRIASSTQSAQSEQIGNRGIGSASAQVDGYAIRYVNIAGRNESLTSGLSGIKRGICRTQDGRQMPGVELVMGAILTSAAIAKARRGAAQESELVDEQNGGRKLSWLQALIADRQKKQKENSDDPVDGDPLMAALEVFNDNLKASREAKPAESHKKQESAVLHSRSSSAPLRQKYEITQNDTLERLAEKLFHNRSVSWLIADINQGKIKESTVDEQRVIELYVGQIIELPSAEEAEHYLQELAKRKSRWESAGGRKLITIVTNAGDNADILQDILGKIV